MNHIILISLLAILGIFLTSFVQTSFAEERIIILLPTMGDPECKNNDTCLSPSTIYINIGDTVDLENHASVGFFTFPLGRLTEQGIIPNSEQASAPHLYPSSPVKFEKEGIYYFYDSVHPWIEGKILVGIKDAPEQSYEVSKAKLEQIQQQMNQQQETIDLERAKNHIKELTNNIKDLFEIIGDLEFQVEQLKIENTNLKNKTPQLQESIKTKSKPIASFVDQTKDPQYYIDRYNNEPEYKKWFEENYPDYSIYEAVGKHEPVPDWIKNNSKWWAEGKITENDFVKGIEYLVNKGIIRVN